MRAFVIPFGAFVDPKTGQRSWVVFAQQVDHLLPAWEGKIKSIGGEMEEGEDPLQTIKREAEEEVPGWLEQARIPGTSKGFFGLKASGGFATLVDDDQVQVFMTLVDVGPMSWAAYRRLTRESCPVSMSLSQIRNRGPDAWAFPQVGKAVAAFLESLDLR
jgi:hypothetical protein